MVMPHRRSRGLWRLSYLLAIGLGSAAWGADAGGTSVAHTYHESSILGTSLDLQVVTADKADADKAHAAVLAEIERLRKILSTYDAASELGRVNASRDPVKVSSEVIEVLKLYEQWNKSSSGAYSGRLGLLVDQWKNAEKDGKLPEGTTLERTVEAIKQPLWKIDDTAGTVERLGDQAINIDSLGKGFIVSRAAAAGRAVPNIRGLLLNIGGDITALGTSSLTGIEPWVVGIADPAHPADNAAPLLSVKIAGYSVATSGSYERGYQIGGTKYSHILDPRTGYPIDAAEAPGGKRNPLVASATVIARDNATANALATSLCVLTPEEGLALVARTTGAEALIVLADGQQRRSAGFSRYETESKALAADGWPDGFEMSLTLVQGNFRRRPYVAVWVEDATGKHVATLAQWGNNQRWTNSLTSWWRFAQRDANLVRAVSRATRPAGQYKLVWDGKDQAGNVVAPGTYKVCIEMAVENQGHSVSSATIMCGDQEATATIPATRHFGETQVEFAAKGT